MIELTAEGLALHVASILAARTAAPEEGPLPWTHVGGEYMTSDRVWVASRYGLVTGTFTVELYKGLEPPSEGSDTYWSLRVRNAEGVEAGYARTHDYSSPLAKLATAVAAQLEQPEQAMRRFIATEVELL